MDNNLPIEKKGAGDTGMDRVISKFNDLSKEGKIEMVSFFISELKRLHDINEQDIFNRKEISIPIGIFSNDALSSLEAIVKYLKEDLKLKFSKIAKILNRSSKTIWATYQKSLKKMPSSFGTVSREVVIPASAISNRSFSTLESVVGYVKDLNYSNHEIGAILHLDDRTIWTVYDRVKKKRGMGEKFSGAPAYNPEG